MTTFKPSPTIKRVLSGELCAGCGLCAGVSGGAVEMTTVEGFLRPRQQATLSPEAEEKVAIACPGAEVEGWPQDADPFWGRALEIAAAHSHDPEVRFVGSSGGALTALAQFTLSSGLVDGVVHVGADEADPIANRVKISRSLAEIQQGSGSRYAPSSPLATIDSLLSSEDRYAFIGKPCDISALRRLAAVDPRVDLTFPYKLSFFCGGVPSHSGAEAILREMDVQRAALTSFRYRGYGWPGLTRAVTADGTEKTMTYPVSWGHHLSKHIQFRCKICPDAVAGVADLAAADAWYGGETGYPLFEERDGRSLVLARTNVGLRLLQASRDAGVLQTEPVPLEDIERMQPGQFNKKRLVLPRTWAARVLFQPVPAMKGLKVRSAARRTSLSDFARNFLGTARRIVLGKR